MPQEFLLHFYICCKVKIPGGSGTPIALGEDFPAFLASQNRIDARADFRTDFPTRKSHLRVSEKQVQTGTESVPTGMAVIPPAVLNMQVTFQVRERGFYEPQTDIVVDDSNLHKPLRFSREVHLPRYAIDLTPVTNAQFAEFLEQSGYRPAQEENFLKLWNHSRTPEGKEDHPVVYVDLEDARTYERWAGKHLPTEEELQYAAQGPDQLLYPWGNEMKAGAANGGELGDTTPVTAFPAGRSPFGCYDMCGNVWEWTESERSDWRTRFCIFKGGSYFKTRGSEWYSDGARHPRSSQPNSSSCGPGSTGVRRLDSAALRICTGDSRLRLRAASRDGNE